MLAWSRIARITAVQVAVAAFILVPAGSSMAATAADSGLKIGPVAPETPGLKAAPQKPARTKAAAPQTRIVKAKTPATKKAAQRIVKVAPAAAPSKRAVASTSDVAATSSMGSTTLTMSAAQTPDTKDTLITLGPWLLLGTLTYALLLATRRYTMERLRQPAA